eukprot:s8226_g2.t1
MQPKFPVCQGFSGCILRVVNLLGDADTTGAVAGQMAGALYGWQAVAGDEWARSRLLEVQRWDPYAEIGVRAALLYHLFPAGREVQLCQREGHATIRVFDHPSENSRSLVGEIKSETRVQQRSLFGNFAKVIGKDLHDQDICGWVGIKNVQPVDEKWDVSEEGRLSDHLSAKQALCAGSDDNAPPDDVWYILLQEECRASKHRARERIRLKTVVDNASVSTWSSEYCTNALNFLSNGCSRMPYLQSARS